MNNNIHNNKKNNIIYLFLINYNPQLYIMNINESFFSQSYEYFKDSILANNFESISHIFPPLDYDNITLNKSSPIWKAHILLTI